MIVFYYAVDGEYHFDFIQWYSEYIYPEDISWWAVPGTLED